MHRDQLAVGTKSLRHALVGAVLAGGLSINGAAVAAPPMVRPDIYLVTTPLVSLQPHGNDGNGEILTLNGCGAAMQGRTTVFSTSFAAFCNYEFTPKPFTGTTTDSFTYTVANLRGEEASGTVQLTIVNRPPRPVPDQNVSFLVPDQVSAAFKIDTAADDAVTVQVTGAGGGATTCARVVAPSNGALDCEYFPPPGFLGVETFTLTQTDAFGASAPPSTIAFDVQRRLDVLPVGPTRRTLKLRRVIYPRGGGTEQIAYTGSVEQVLRVTNPNLTPTTIESLGICARLPVPAAYSQARLLPKLLTVGMQVLHPTRGSRQEWSLRGHVGSICDDVLPRRAPPGFAHVGNGVSLNGANGHVLQGGASVLVRYRFDVRLLHRSRQRITLTTLLRGGNDDHVLSMVVTPSTILRLIYPRPTGAK